MNTISEMSFSKLIKNNAIKAPSMTTQFIKLLNEKKILEPIEYINKVPRYYDSQILVILEVMRIKNGFKDISELKNFKTIKYYNKWSLLVKELEDFFENKKIYKDKKYDEFYKDSLKRKTKLSNITKDLKEILKEEARFDAKLDFKDWWQNEDGYTGIKKDFVNFITNKLKITLKELKDFRFNVALFSSFHRMYSQASYLFWNYVKYIPDNVFIKFEYIHYLTDLLNEYISFFDGENFLSVKHVIYDIKNGYINYEKNPDVICKYCGEKYIKKYRNQKHCLKEECAKKHKKVLDRINYQKNKDKKKEQRKNRLKKS